MPITYQLSAVLCLSLPVQAQQMDFRVFRLLSTGMTEGELLQRAGPPDHVESNTNWVYVPYSPYPQPVESKRLFYYADPSSHDPQLTIVSLNGGQISNLERQRVNSRSIPGTGTLGPPPDYDTYGGARIQESGRDRQGAQSDAVLRAARELREIQERHRQSSGLGTTPPSVRRWMDKKGAIHYDDGAPLR